MNDPVLNSYSLDSIAAALAFAMDIDAPSFAAPPNPALVQLARPVSSAPVDRILMYNPDAVAMWLYQKYPDFYLPVQRHTQLTLPLCSVMPSVTPVCFGTMYTGAQPEVHGIRAYEKPVITIDTLFDRLIRSGKRPVICCTDGDSLSRIFLKRDMEYYFYPTIKEVNEKALELIRGNAHDFIVVYNGDYDATMHRWSPEGVSSLEALRSDMSSFDVLVTEARTSWKNYRSLIGFAPDHGCHEIDGGLGSHGLSMPEDLNILHLYGILEPIQI